MNIGNQNKICRAIIDYMDSHSISTRALFKDRGLVRRMGYGRGPSAECYVANLRNQGIYSGTRDLTTQLQRAALVLEAMEVPADHEIIRLIKQEEPKFEYPPHKSLVVPNLEVVRDRNKRTETQKPKPSPKTLRGRVALLERKVDALENCLYTVMGITDPVERP
jgi:hypothetical protein